MSSTSANQSYSKISNTIVDGSDVAAAMRQIYSSYGIAPQYKVLSGTISMTGNSATYFPIIDDSTGLCMTIKSSAAIRSWSIQVLPSTNSTAAIGLTGAGGTMVLVQSTSPSAISSTIYAICGTGVTAFAVATSPTATPTTPIWMIGTQTGGVAGPPNTTSWAAQFGQNLCTNTYPTTSVFYLGLSTVATTLTGRLRVTIGYTDA